MIWEETTDDHYFWFYKNLKFLVNKDLGGVLLFFRSYTDMNDDDIMDMFFCVIKGKTIRKHYRSIKEDVKNRFICPRYNFESWTENPFLI